MKGDGYHDIEPLDWLAWAEDRGITPACRGTDTDLFFPEWVSSGVPQPRHREQVAEAKAICRRCPLLEMCRTWALRQPWQHLYGIHGGMTQHERHMAQQERTAA